MSSSSSRLESSTALPTGTSGKVNLVVLAGDPSRPGCNRSVWTDCTLHSARRSVCAMTVSGNNDDDDAADALAEVHT
eukprot:scaffold4013_cov140-Isochrysis_galbana.AAC.4